MVGRSGSSGGSTRSSSGGHLAPEVILERIARVGDAVHRHTRKLVISFADVERYPAVRRRIGCGCGGLQEPDAAAVARIAAGIGELNRAWGLDVATCAETVDLAGYGIVRNRCVDDELMARAFSGDAALMAFLGRGRGGERAAFRRSRRRRGRPPAQGQGAARGVRVHRQQGHRPLRHLHARLCVLLRERLPRRGGCGARPARPGNGELY